MNVLAHFFAIATGIEGTKFWLAAVVTLLFAAFGRLVRGVTNSGAVAGAMVCFALLSGTGWAGFAALCAVFILTWAATRLGYSRKLVLGTAEARSGRTSAQVFANLGVAAICAALLAMKPGLGLWLAAGAALCEAATDTVSSEIGQAIGGTPRLITSWQPVKPGTDGAITLAGTIVGASAGIIIGAVYAYFLPGHWHAAAVCAGAGIAGTLADSLLGATIERKGLLGNNAVNFLSTLIAAGIAALVA